MTAKDKHLAAVRRLEKPPLFHCGDRAMINPDNTLEFVCPNRHELICVEILSYMCHVLISRYLGVFNGEVSFQEVVVWS